MSTSLTLTLATQVHSLARYSERTIHIAAYLSNLLDFRIFSLSITSSFQHFPHSTLYAIGLKKYLRLEVNDSQFQTQIPMSLTQDTRTSFCLLLRDYHPLSYLISENFESTESD